MIFLLQLFLLLPAIITRVIRKPPATTTVGSKVLRPVVGLTRLLLQADEGETEP